MATKCPRCFDTLSDALYAWKCESPDCVQRPDALASAYESLPRNSPNIDIISRPADAKKWVGPTSWGCSACGSRAREVCPRCHYDLPDDWRAGMATCIALAGARATGKSVYIGVLVKQFEQLLLQAGHSLSFVGSREQYELIYERPLFEARGIIPPTPRANTEDASFVRTPLILSMGIIAGIRRYLVLRDVAGEDLEKPDTSQTYLSYFGRAHAVFFMFDPSAVGPIRDLLKDLLPVQLHEAGDPRRVLENVTQLIGEASPQVAMILSKFDTMQALRHVWGTEWSRVMSNPGAAFQRDPGMLTATYDDADGGLLSAEAESLLERLDTKQFVTSMVNPHRGHAFRHRFFTVSALGEAAEGQQIHKRGIASFRCLDPLRWVLVDQGVI